MLSPQISPSLLNLSKPRGHLPSAGWTVVSQRLCGWGEGGTEKNHAPSSEALPAESTHPGCPAMTGAPAESPVPFHHLRQLSAELGFLSALFHPASPPNSEIICFKIKPSPSPSVVFNLFWVTCPCENLLKAMSSLSRKMSRGYALVFFEFQGFHKSLKIQERNHYLCQRDPSHSSSWMSEMNTSRLKRVRALGGMSGDEQTADAAASGPQDSWWRFQKPPPEALCSQTSPHRCPQVARLLTSAPPVALAPPSD